MKTSTINLFRIFWVLFVHASDKTTCSFNRFCFAFQQPDPVTASLSFLLPSPSLCLSLLKLPNIHLWNFKMLKIYPVNFSPKIIDTRKQKRKFVVTKKYFYDIWKKNAIGIHYTMYVVHAVSSSSQMIGVTMFMLYLFLLFKNNIICLVRWDGDMVVKFRFSHQFDWIFAFCKCDVLIAC